MASYAFLTTWLLDAPVDRVYAVLRESTDYPRWWSNARSVETLQDGDERGVGQLDRYVWRSALPYSLTFDARVTRVEPQRLIEARVALETYRTVDSSGTLVRPGKHVIRDAVQGFLAA